MSKKIAPIAKTWNKESYVVHVVENSLCHTHISSVIALHERIRRRKKKIRMQLLTPLLSMPLRCSTFTIPFARRVHAKVCRYYVRLVV